METHSVRMARALAIVMLATGLTATLPGIAAASETGASGTVGAAIDYDHTYYADHPAKCEAARRDYAQWAWVSECYRYGLSLWAFDYSCRIC